MPRGVPSIKDKLEAALQELALEHRRTGAVRVVFRKFLLAGYKLVERNKLPSLA
jgi:hypothetical protein